MSFISVTITHWLSWWGLLCFQVKTLRTMHTVPSTVGPPCFLMDTVAAGIVNGCENIYFLCNQFEFIVFSMLAHAIWIHRDLRKYGITLMQIIQ